MHLFTFTLQTLLHFHTISFCSHLFIYLCVSIFITIRANKQYNTSLKKSKYKTKSNHPFKKTNWITKRRYSSTHPHALSANLASIRVSSRSQFLSSSHSPRRTSRRRWSSSAPSSHSPLSSRPRHITCSCLEQCIRNASNRSWIIKKKRFVWCYIYMSCFICNCHSNFWVVILLLLFSK